MKNDLQVLIYFEYFLHQGLWHHQSWFTAILGMLQSILSESMKNISLCSQYFFAALLLMKIQSSYGVSFDAR